MGFWRFEWALFSLSLLSCAQPSPVPGRFPAEAIPLPPDANEYSTSVQPKGADGGAGLIELEADVLAALAKRGDRAEADGALGAAASWALAEVNSGHTVDVTAAESAARHFGYAGVLLSIAVMGMHAQGGWREQLDRAPRNMPITRYGIRVSPSGYSAALMFGSTELSYQAIPRTYQPGQSVALKGELGSRFTFGHVYLTKPDGSVGEQRLANRTLDVAFPLEVSGKYQLEVMGDGETGPVVLSNVPLYVGVPEPAARSIAGTAVEPEQAEARLLTLLNEARRAAGLADVKPDVELREIALAHATDMRDHHFFSHISPRSGSPEDRVRRSHALISMSGENIAEAPTPESAHAGLMSSPGHRANMLRPEFTHVGIGARENQGGVVITLLFGRRPDPRDLPTSAAQLEAAIVSLRAEKNLQEAKFDSIYRVAAQAGADAFADDGNPGAIGKAVESALVREVKRRQSGRPSACIEALELLELSQLTQFPGLSQPALRRIGVGARLHRDSRGARLSTVLLLEGVPCQ